MYVESCLAHHDEVLAIKDAVIKGDVFHLISGVWRSPAERCFLWLGGFRPSEVIKVRLLTIAFLFSDRINPSPRSSVGHSHHLGCSNSCLTLWGEFFCLLGNIDKTKLKWEHISF